METIVGMPFVEGEVGIEPEVCDDFVGHPGIVVACVVVQVTCSTHFGVFVLDAEVVESLVEPRILLIFVFANSEIGHIIPVSTLLCAFKNMFPSDEIPRNKRVSIERENIFQALILFVACLFILPLASILFMSLLLDSSSAATATAMGISSLIHVNFTSIGEEGDGGKPTLGCLGLKFVPLLMREDIMKQENKPRNETTIEVVVRWCETRSAMFVIPNAKLFRRPWNQISVTSPLPLH